MLLKRAGWQLDRNKMFQLDEQEQLQLQAKCRYVSDQLSTPYRGADRVSKMSTLHEVDTYDREQLRVKQPAGSGQQA